MAQCRNPHSNLGSASLPLKILQCNKISLLRLMENDMANELATTDSLNDLRAQLRQFTAERQWEQFHTPKNLASALIVEAAELLEPFQWLNNGKADELGAEKLQAVRHEMADVMAYLIMLAEQLNIDLIAATNELLL